MSARPPSTTGAGLRFGAGLLKTVPPVGLGLRCSKDCAKSLGRYHGAKLWELRAATVLPCFGPTRQAQRARPARPGYGWFTEGFDTRTRNDGDALERSVDFRPWLVLAIGPG